jgi:hypothetical protein
MAQEGRKGKQPEKDDIQALDANDSHVQAPLPEGKKARQLLPPPH